MPKIVNIQARINDVAFELNKGTQRKFIVEKFTKKWKVGKTIIDKYIKDAKEQAKERQERRQRALDEQLVSEGLDAQKQGLKSKTERVLNLQKQIDDIQADLETGKTFDYYVIKGEIKRIAKDLTPLEKATLRRTIKDIQSEISKIEGDYAPTKAEHTGKNGKDLNPPVINFVSASQLTDEQLQQIIGDAGNNNDNL